MKKKRKTGLPRVTVLAMDRKALLAFVESVAALKYAVDDLRAEVDRLKAKKTPAPKSPATPAAGPAQGGTT